MLVSPLVVRQAVPMPLTARERAVLDLERTWCTLDDPRAELPRARRARYHEVAR
jgi:hypothetical protein